MKKGEKYENLVLEYLKTSGYKILVRNYRCPEGEIDIVAQEGEDLVFVEVKGEKENPYTHPAERFDQRKLSRIIACAYKFMENYGISSAFRIDLITVKGGEIEHFKNVGFMDL